MGQLGLGDGFVEWLRETFVDEEQEDDLLVDQPSSLLMGRQWGTQTVVFPDTQQLVQQMQAPVELACQPLTPDAGDASAQHSRDTAQEPQEHGSRAKGSKKAVRPKNTKRYKSLAQKEAHKRYRERKKQSISQMEQEVAAKLQLLQELEAENSALKSKMRVLETSVNCSTQIHGLMQLINGVGSMAVNDNPSYSGTTGETSTTSRSSSEAAAAAAPAGPCLHYQHCSSSSMSACVDTPSGLEAVSCGSSGHQQQQGQQPQPQQVCCKQEELSGMALQPWEATCVQQQQQQQQQWGRTVTTDMQATSKLLSDSGQLLQLAPSAHSVSMPTKADAIAEQLAYPAHSSHGMAAAAAAAAAAGVYGSAPDAAAAAAAGGSSGVWLDQRDALRSLSGVAEQSSGTLQEIFAEAKQQSQEQWLQANGGSVTAAVVNAANPDPLATAVSSVEQGVVAYKAFLQRASALMMERESGDPEVAAIAEQQLDAFTRSTISQVFQPFIVAKGQGMIYDWTMRSLETSQQQEPPDDLWPHVLQQMRLSPQQQQDALACYHMFGVCLSKLVDQRLAFTAQYKALQQAEEVAVHDRNWKKKLHLKIQSMEMLQAISKSLAAYQSLDGVFAHSVTSIITGSQLAVACVHSYPFIPNWHKIMHSLQLQVELQLQEQQQEVEMQQAQQKPARRGRVGRSAQHLGVQHVVKA